MKDAEDEAFEQLALKQGQWEHTSGWRKRRIIDADYGALELRVAVYENERRNQTLEDVAVELETKFTMPFGRDTVASFAAFVRGMKR
jgi:hypothetical protein